MKIIKKSFVVLIMSFVLFLTACSQVDRAPLTVTFIDISGAMSADHTISIKFAEEKFYEGKFVDILVKSDTDGVVLTLFQEFSSEEDKVVINLEKSIYVSLDEYKLFKLENEQTDSMVGYGDALATNLVINSNKDATITFWAVVGDKENGNFKQTGLASNEYTLKVKKKTEK